MFKEKLAAGLAKIPPAVKLGAAQAAKGKPGVLAAAFAKNGRDSKAATKKPR